MHRLTARFCQTVKRKGRHGDGGGLYLIVSRTGARSWMFIWQRDGKRHEMGLGSFRTTSLAQAREKARLARSDVAEGRDPRERRGGQHKPTFGQCADALLAALEPTWSNKKHAHQWRRSLTVEAAALRDLPVNEITTEAVLAVLKPTWLTRGPSTARLRLRIEKTLDYAKARGYRQGENVARWRGHLQHLLPRVPRAPRHHPALSYEAVPGFWATLSGMEVVSAYALRLVILTASRSNEVLWARWDEIDFDSAVWEIPAERMKGRRAHRVPLSEPALVLLRKLHEVRVSEYVFPSPIPGRPLAHGAMFNLIRRLGRSDFSAHGFRSSFRDWCGDRGVARETAEAALAHQVGNAVEQAYRRGDSFEARRKLMADWAAYVTNEGAGATVVALRR
jgi:integrase